jgi:cell wall-associated NlpC family hydrolase
MTEAALRQRIIDEAESWLCTPYHHAAAVKGAGVDCAQILIEVYAAVGLADKFATDYYPSDWMLHRSEERYLANVEKYCIEVEKPAMGDIALFKFGRCFSHSGIVTVWPQIIHAQREDGCCYADATQGVLADRAVKFYSFFGVDK